MVLLNNPDLLTAEELVQAANELLGDLAGSFRIPPAPFKGTIRTVSYYTQLGILPRIRGIQGPNRYPREWAYRFVFVRRLQQEITSSMRERLEAELGEDPSQLGGIAKVLESLPEWRIREIALGNEPVQVLPVSLEAAAPKGFSAMRVKSQSASIPTTNTDWTTLHKGPNTWLQVRADSLSPRQRQELEVLSKLIEKYLTTDPD